VLFLQRKSRILWLLAAVAAQVPTILAVAVLEVYEAAL
jgi:hypothetical protein